MALQRKKLLLIPILSGVVLTLGALAIYLSSFEETPESALLAWRQLGCNKYYTTLPDEIYIIDFSRDGAWGFAIIADDKTPKSHLGCAVFRRERSWPRRKWRPVHVVVAAIEGQKLRCVSDFITMDIDQSVMSSKIIKYEGDLAKLQRMWDEHITSKGYDLVGNLWEREFPMRLTGRPAAGS